MHNRTESLVFLELPHGGNLIPDEVADYIDTNLTAEHVRKDSDEFSDEIFHKLNVSHVALRGEYYRAFIDLNRKSTDFGSDGVVKTHTSQGVQIYNSENGLPNDVAQQIVQEYVHPYFTQFIDILNQPSVVQAISCHTMPALGTPNSLADDVGIYRPIFSLINGGDENGDNPPHQDFCSGERLRAVSAILEKYLQNLDTKFNFSSTIAYNNPYPTFVSPDRFPDGVFKGKHPFCIEVNRELVRTNLSNIPVLRNMMCEVVNMLSNCKL